MPEKPYRRSRWPFTLPRRLLGRLYLLAAVLALDVVALASVPHIRPLLGPVAPAGIAAIAVFLGLSHSTLRESREELRFSWPLFSVHLLCIALVVLYYVASLRRPDLFASRVLQLGPRAIVFTAVALLALACIPFSTWLKTVRETKSLWISALLAGVAAGILRHPFQSLWNSSSFAAGVALQRATFHAAEGLLHLLLPDLITDPATFTLGTPRFLVFIAPECSGMEGLGLVLVFTLVWLFYFRKESRFPQAFLLVPCALISVWLLNIIRIAAIILIGNAGAPDVAMIGFHSQAGWIAFTAVALLFSVMTRKISWVRRTPAESVLVPSVSMQNIEQGESPATPEFLVPFLAILAASFISKAASASFEWLYPLRFIAGLISIWYFRKKYRGLEWRFDWMAPVTGAAVFIIWITPSLWLHGISPSSLGAALSALPPASRTAWIAVRVAAAVFTVPIAEELAFRGYLARRLVSRDFDALPFSRLTLISICVSSLAFGLMHGSHWLAGIVAGAAYAMLLKRRGRIGEAIVAHATSNLLIAVWVLSRGDWSLW